MHIWTDAPVAEMWRQLRYFAAPSNVERVLSGQTRSRRTRVWKSDEAAQQARGIAACIEQADEYFHASRTVGLPTKPLLQFYGAESLAKAAILAADPQVSLQNLKYHGLSTRPSSASESARAKLGKYAESPEDWVLGREYAVTNSGVFPHLARVAGDRNVQIGCVLRLRELMRRMPDLAQIYERHYDELSLCARLYKRPTTPEGEPFSIYFTVKNTHQLLEIFPEFGKGFEEIERHGNAGFRASSKDSAEPSFGCVVRHSVAGDYFVRPHEAGIVTSTASLFAASFIVSNIVRYKPAFWMTVLEGAVSGDAALVEMLCDVIERRFPHDILESLWEERFTFGSPAYMA